MITESLKEEMAKVTLLIKEGDSYQEINQQMRRERVDKTLESVDRYDKFSIRIGELSLAVAAALTPVLIIKTTEVAYKEFVIVGLFVYLITGIGTLLRAKKRVEDDLDNNASMGIDLELDATKIINSINKLISNPSDKSYIKSYKEAIKNFIKNRTLVRLNSSDRIDYYLDIVAGCFIVATIINTRAIWPFSSLSYWIFVATALIIYILICFKSAMTATKKQCKKIDIQKQSDYEDSAYTEWFADQYLNDEEEK